MNFRQLKYFLHVVEEGSFSAASRRLNIAQPALSGHVATLEQELDVKLFERSNRGVRVTSAGRRLKEHAKTILRQIDTVKADISGSPDNPGGEVAIALPFTAARLVAGPIMRAVEQKFPRISLTIVEGLSRESGDIMASGRVDLGVVPNAAEIENLEAEPLFHEHLYLIGRWDGKLPREGEISFIDLPKYPLGLGSKNWNLRRSIEQAALDMGIQLNVQYETSGAESLGSMVVEGLCHTITNWASIQSQWNLREFFAWKITSPEIQRTIALAWPSERPMTAAVEGVREIVKQILIDAVKQKRWRADLLEGESEKI